MMHADLIIKKHFKAPQGALKSLLWGWDKYPLHLLQIRVLDQGYKNQHDTDP